MSHRDLTSVDMSGASHMMIIGAPVEAKPRSEPSIKRTMPAQEGRSSGWNFFSTNCWLVRGAALTGDSLVGGEAAAVRLTPVRVLLWSIDEF